MILDGAMESAVKLYADLPETDAPGTLRFCAETGRLHVYDGKCWLTMERSVSEAALDFALRSVGFVQSVGVSKWERGKCVVELHPGNALTIHHEDNVYRGPVPQTIDDVMSILTAVCHYSFVPAP